MAKATGMSRTTIHRIWRACSRIVSETFNCLFPSQAGGAGVGQTHLVLTPRSEPSYGTLRRRQRMEQHRYARFFGASEVPLCAFAHVSAFQQCLLIKRHL